MEEIISPSETPHRSIYAIWAQEGRTSSFLRTIWYCNWMEFGICHNMSFSSQDALHKHTEVKIEEVVSCRMDQLHPTSRSGRACVHHNQPGKACSESRQQSFAHWHSMWLWRKGSVVRTCPVQNQQLHMLVTFLWPIYAAFQGLRLEFQGRSEDFQWCENSIKGDESNGRCEKWPRIRRQQKTLGF